ncbi:MAG: hypothetical protein ACREDR_19395 [Blastocatellia bacterium]
MSNWFLSTLCVFAALQGVGASHFGSALASPRSDVAEIPLLLERLRPRAVLGVAMGYSAGTEEIKGELVRIAEQSPEGRAEVIGQLLRALSEPSAGDTFGFLGEYRSAISAVLGEIRATEAIDFLVGHLAWSRDGTTSLTYSTRPCVLALVMIG